MWSDVQEHLGLLCGLAGECKVVVEFGFRHGVSTSALLAAGPKVYSYDLTECIPHSNNLRKLHPNFEFRRQSSLEAEIPLCDLLFIDSKHDYKVLSRELARHHCRVQRWIAMHDTHTFGQSGESGGDPGLKRAIDEFLVANDEWRLLLSLKNCNGLTILERTRHKDMIVYDPNYTKPWWAQPAIDLVEKFLQENKGARVFEWGSGISSRWLAERCGFLVTVEDKDEWFERVTGFLEPYPHATVVPSELGCEVYANEIDKHNGPFDLIVVDGFERLQCVVKAVDRLRPGGMLVFDDSQEAPYRQAVEHLSAWPGDSSTTDYGKKTTIYTRPNTPHLDRNATLPRFFIPTRDRLGCLLYLLAWLNVRGMPKEHIWLVDNGSTYRPLLAGLEEAKGAGMNVVTQKNLGARALFLPGGVIEKAIGRKHPFFVSDPDVVPSVTCRPDLLTHLVACMNRYGKFNKIGLALEIEDIPDHFPFKAQVVRHERSFWGNRVNDHLVPAAIATTFCLVRSLNHCDRQGYAHGCARTLRPNTGIHTSWYLNPAKLPEDEAYYYDHVPHRQGTGPGATFGFKEGQAWRA